MDDSTYTLPPTSKFDILRQTMDLRVVKYRKGYASGANGDGIDSYREITRIEQRWVSYSGGSEWRPLPEIEDTINQMGDEETKCLNYMT